MEIGQHYCVHAHMLSHQIVRENPQGSASCVIMCHSRDLLVENDESVCFAFRHETVSQCLFCPVFSISHFLNGSGRRISQTLTRNLRERLHHTLKTSPLSMWCCRYLSTIQRTPLHDRSRSSNCYMLVRVFEQEVRSSDICSSLRLILVQCIKQQHLCLKWYIRYIYGIYMVIIIIIYTFLIP